MPDSLSDFEKAHAESILDPDPTLEPTPPAKVVRILVGSVIRKTPEVVAGFLKTLDWQKTRTKCEVDYFFLTNFASEDSHTNDVHALLRAFHPDRHKIQAAEAPTGDYGEGERSRNWTPAAWHRVGALKNLILQQALTEAYDFVWLVDADVLCDPYTLQSLLDSANVESLLLDGSRYRGPIVTGVYWTFWSKRNPDDAVTQHAGPQVWLRHPYTLSGRGWNESTFRAALVERQRLRVWGLGACTLIPIAALRKGANFSRAADLPSGPMSDGEDRHFCWRADALHIELVADAWSDIYHAYWPDEYDTIPEFLEGLERGQTRPSLGDLVSLRVQNTAAPSSLEAEFIRGRLGSLNLLPELEEAVYGLEIGASKLLKVHFPSHYVRPELRNRDCVMRLTLQDAKPWKLAPTIDQEQFVGGQSKSLMDPTTLSSDQVDDVLETAGMA